MTKLYNFIRLLVTLSTLGKCSTATPWHYESRVIDEVAGGQLDQTDIIYDNLPCPNEADILPCKCDFTNGLMSMNCNHVEEEDELRTVFEANFPFNNFTAFRMGSKYGITVLESGVFNGVTFKEFYIHIGNLERIKFDAFDDSLDTARVINLLSCNITQFPYEMLQKFSNLTILDLSGNPLTSVPVTSFQGIPTLKELHLNAIHVDELLVGTFQNLPNLEMLYLNANSLTHIPSGLFETGSNQLKEVHIYNNKIQSVEPNAFENIGMSIDMDYNAMSVIEENTWRLLLEGGATLNLGRNPLVCDCGIAWLVRNQTFMQRISQFSYCNADLVHSIWDLNPDDFVGC